MKKRKVVSLALVSLLSLGVLTGCGVKDTGTEISNDVEVEKDVLEIINFEKQYFEQYLEVPEVKIFEPGEHVFFIRYYHSTSPQLTRGGSIIVPDGYQVKEIENFNEYVGYGSQTSGVDIWYENTETVRVEPVYKEEYGQNDIRGFYDYANFGSVIELDQSQDNNKILTK